MTTTKVLRVLDADEACARILAAGYAKHPCAACDGKGHRDTAAHRTFTDSPDRIRKLCGICDGAGFTWEPSAKKSQP